MAILLTGSTGYLGSLLTAALLSRSSERLVLPIRAHHSEESFIKHIQSTIEAEGEHFTPEMRSRVEVLTLPQSGEVSLLEPILRDLAVEEILHSAGNLNYFDKEKLYAGNIQYTQDLLEIGKNLDIKKFTFISTAFSSGYTDQLIREEFHEEPESDPTYYTVTKRRAEHLVGKSGLPFLIIRPSIVIGDSRDGHYRGKNYGIYQLLSFMERLSTKNYVPVFNTVAPPLPLHVLHQDAFWQGALGAREYLPLNSIINLVSKQDSLPTLRDFNDLALKYGLHPQKVIYYPRAEAVPFDQIDLPQKLLLQFSEVNREIATHHWNFESENLNYLRKLGVPFVDATPHTLLKCIQNFMAHSPNLQEYFKKFSENFPKDFERVEITG